jgi:hypothetical protein
MMKQQYFYTHLLQGIIYLIYFAFRMKCIIFKKDLILFIACPQKASVKSYG